LGYFCFAKIKSIYFVTFTICYKYSLTSSASHWTRQKTFTCKRVKNVVCKCWNHNYWALSIWWKINCFIPVWLSGKFLAMNGTAFSWKRGQLCELYQNFRTISVPLNAKSTFDFPPGISGNFSWMVCFSEIQNLWKLSSEISIPFATVLKFWDFRLNGKCPLSA